MTIKLNLTRQELVEYEELQRQTGLRGEALQQAWLNRPRKAEQSPEGSPHNPEMDSERMHAWSGRGSK